MTHLLESLSIEITTVMGVEIERLGGLAASLPVQGEDDDMAGSNAVRCTRRSSIFLKLSMRCRRVTSVVACVLDFLHCSGCEQAGAMRPLLRFRQHRHLTGFFKFSLLIASSLSRRDAGLINRINARRYCL